MEHCLFILLFLTGVFPLVQSVHHRYYLIQQGKTWSDAQAYCRINHNDLAIIESNDNMIQLQNEAQTQQFSSSAWIGLYNEINSWRWSLGNEILGSMTGWLQGQPNNIDGHQECAAISSWGWDDRPCTFTLPFVCFDGSKADSQRYIYISNLVTWPEAQSYCRHHHTDLASARDATENLLVQALVPEWTWFGLFRDSWKWTDQTNFSTISWMSGKPDNALRNENCGYLYHSQAADAQCSDIMPFFCYSVITGKNQIIRVKIQSNQEVNNLAVKMATLKEMNQKLKDYGMAENITVKWRAQPCGVVFHKKKENNTIEAKEDCSLQ